MSDRPREWFAIADTEGEPLFELFCHPPQTLAWVKAKYPACHVKPMPKAGTVTIFDVGPEFEW